MGRHSKVVNIKCPLAFKCYDQTELEAKLVLCCHGPSNCSRTYILIRVRLEPNTEAKPVDGFESFTALCRVCS